jgi:hypothetical protein
MQTRKHSAKETAMPMLTDSKRRTARATGFEMRSETNWLKVKDLATVKSTAKAMPTERVMVIEKLTD